MLLEPFFLKAMIAGFGVALMCGVLGCFVAWKRMAYFGDTIAHAAILGVVLSLLFDVKPEIGIILVSLGLALAVAYFQRQKQLASDTLLGVSAHGALAIGLVLLSLSRENVDIGGYLFGDILAVNVHDVAYIYLCLIVVAGLTHHLWRDLLRITLHADIAQVEGVPVEHRRLALMLLVALTVAVSIKIVGMLLITALLIIPAAAARYFAATPTHMAALSSVAGLLSVFTGLTGSAYWDTPSGPSIVVAAMLIFLLAHAFRSKRG